LCAKIIELIHENVYVGTIQDDLEEIGLIEEMLEVILTTDTPEKKAKEIQFKLTNRLQKYLGNPKFKRLYERLEKLKEQHESGQLLSINILKALLDLSKDLVIL